MSGSPQSSGVSTGRCWLRELIACEQHGNVWKDTLMAAASHDGFRYPGKCSSGCQAGEWYAPCVEAYPRGQCARPRRLLVFTHMPKAGGSSFGEMLEAGLAQHSPLAPCHFFWNGRGQRPVCNALRTWLSRSSVQTAPPLPSRRGSGNTTAAAADASLASAVPFRHCGLLWAQHADFSIVEQIRRSRPQAKVHALLVIRHPVERFFSEFRYKKHCLWRQMGLPAPPSDLHSLGDHISRLRASAGLRSQLLRFLAGASWCSCPPPGARSPAESALANHSLLHAIAAANARSYRFIGVMEMMPQSLRLLRAILGWSARRHEPVKSNEFSACKGITHVPVSDQPSAQQHAEVEQLLATDTSFYLELVARFRSLYEQRFGADPGAEQEA